MSFFDRRQVLSFLATLPAVRFFRRETNDVDVIDVYEPAVFVASPVPLRKGLCIDLLAHVKDGKFEKMARFRGLARRGVGTWRLYFQEPRQRPLTVQVLPEAPEHLHGGPALAFLTVSFPGGYPEEYVEVRTLNLEGTPIDLDFFFVGLST